MALRGVKPGFWRFAGSSLGFGFWSAWNEELRAVLPTRERGDTMGVARTAAVLRKPPLPGTILPPAAQAAE